MSSEIGLYDAWRAWISGTEVRDHVLWGISILAWGRIGKILEFLAAITVVAEIIGRERLKKIVGSMRAIIAEVLSYFAASKSFLCQVALDLLREIPPLNFNKIRERNMSPLYDHIMKAPWVPFAMLIPGVIVTAALVTGFKGRPIANIGGLADWAIFIVTFLFVYVPVGMSLLLFVALTIFLSALFGASISFVFLGSLAFIAHYSTNVRLVKALGVPLLLIGFLFDLLAS